MEIDFGLILKGFLLPLAAAGAAAWAIWFISKGFLSSSKTRAEKALADFNRSYEEAAKPETQVRMGTKEYKIRLAFASYGLNVVGWEQVAVYLSYAVLAAVVAIPALLFGLPPVMVLGAPILSFIIVNALVDSKWDKMRLAIEREIPLMLTRLSSLLKANPNLIETLDNIADGLDPDKPLKAWVRRFASNLQASGRKGLDDMRLEASDISPSLLLAVVIIGRTWETSGKGYTDALRMTSENMATLMETRSQAGAVAAGAWSTSRTILLALGFTLCVVLVNPVSRPFFATVLIQAILLAVMVWGSIGYWNIRDSINQVVE